METSPTIISLHLYFLLLLCLLCLGVSLSMTSDAIVQCNGSLTECNINLEMVMESEASRRFLETKKYISPGALKRNQLVCNGGASGEAYSKTSGCLPPQSNPYSRGCPKYYRCRGDS
ncbi:hypothetical protein CsSME_00020221 [Camellia sinensis var. sinensis]